MDFQEFSPLVPVEFYNNTYNEPLQLNINQKKIKILKNIVNEVLDQLVVRDFEYTPQDDALGNKYDWKKAFLKDLMKNIPNPLITEIWKVQPSIGAQPWLVQYVILLQDGSHICTCLMLINKGIICRHFIKILTKSASAFFNISLIPSRWYNDQTAQLSGDEIHASPSIQLFNNSQSESIHITNIHTWILCVEEMFSNPIYVKLRRKPPQKDIRVL
ncbi:hypothetical protein GLOIN_2v1472538 [Rhizophagus clarus]|uniref:SWIM-type domain-containing protein n=1 Tax=Rhizophagus clarus TaxID=94130 RepID=A0A8H3L9P2_9GLOM|nr:hypothetical protein GLOIN_2v1472538 [Rhizophagus clarus]